MFKAKWQIFFMSVRKSIFISIECLTFYNNQLLSNNYWYFDIIQNILTIET